MKHWMRRIVCGLLASAMLTGAAAAAKRQSGLVLADDLSLQGIWTAENGKTSEQLLVYEPGGDVSALVAYGNTLYGRSTMDYIKDYVEEQGYAVVAGINASFFDMSTGIPYGMVVTDGILRTSGNVASVGLDENGVVQIGVPELEVRLSYGSTQAVINYNKALTRQNGLCLYSRDYDYKTKNTISAYNLILEPETDCLTLSGQVEATVKAVMEDTASCEIPEDCFVLSLAAETDYATAIESLKKVKVGDTVTITTTCASRWEDVAYAAGGGEILVEQGTALTEFTLDSAERQAARTALGLKANGDVVCYTVDRSETSDGLTLAELAQRMRELGCVTAINLDGGGSTCVAVTRPGENTFTTVNDPSDGKQRTCANFIFFVRPRTASGSAARLHLYPYDAAVLPGGQLELTVRASDANYMATALPSGVSLSASGGSVSGRMFTADGVGTAVVTASAGGVSGSVEIQVVETPTSIQVYQAGQTGTLDQLLLENGTSVDLTAEAEYLGASLAAQDSSFSWYVPAELGTVDAQGILTAGDTDAKGSLQVSCGARTVTVPVQVRVNPFADVKAHWARSYVFQLYCQGVMQGSVNQTGQMVYRPDASMTRQEFIVSLIRWLGVDTDQYAGETMPFADAGQIASWAKDAMQAAYALGYLTGTGRDGKLYAEPSSTITREAAMTILARTQQAQSDSNALAQFSDEAAVSDWARSALTAMVEQGVIDGVDGHLRPQGKVTRAQVAKMLFAMQ